nr:reverse transcriptase domain-containing protein [Tanacetum cinerariifolium]
SRVGRMGERRGIGGGQCIGGNANTGNDGNNGGNLDITEMITQQLQALFPTLVKQISNGAINQGNGLTNDAVRDGLLKKSGEKIRDDVEPSKQGDNRKNNKRSRIGKGFVATNLGKNKYRSYLPMCAKCNGHHQEFVPYRTHFNCNRPDHIATDY